MVISVIRGFLNTLYHFIPVVRAQHNMASPIAITPNRYFVNPYDDYKESDDVEIKNDLLRDRLKNVLQIITENQSKKLTDCDGGLYVGLSGVAYTFYYMSTLPALADKRDEFLKQATELIGISLQYAQTSDTRLDPKTAVGFLLGNVGVNTVAALIKHSTGNKDQFHTLIKAVVKSAETCTPVNFLRHGSDEMFVGRAGYLSAILLLKNRLHSEVIGHETLSAICSATVTSGKEYAKRFHSQSPLMYAYYDTEYFGAAHGMSAILQILLCFPEFIKDHPDSEKDIRGAVDFLLTLQQPNGNFPCAMEEVRRHRPESEELVHWCHGAPGVVYLMAKAYLYWKEDRYLQSCIKCGDVVWTKGLLRKGPGICHGVAGNGYVFLLLYRLTQDKKYLYRAQRFADFIFTDEFKRNARTPDHPYSLYEGLAGTACFLADLFAPENAAFPLFDIF